MLSRCWRTGPFSSSEQIIYSVLADDRYSSECSLMLSTMCKVDSIASSSQVIRKLIAKFQ